MALRYKGLTVVLRAARERAHEIAQDIVDEIATNPNTPDMRSSTRTGARVYPPHLHLRDAYHVATDLNGDALVKSRNRYWIYVEFGMGHGPKQPHVAPAVEIVRALRS